MEAAQKRAEPHRLDAQEGDSAIEALAAQSNENDVIQLRADAELAAGTLAQVLRAAD